MVEKVDNPLLQDSKRKIWVPMRYVMSLLMFFGFVNVYGMRVNFSLTLLQMVSKNNVSTSNGSWTIHQDFDWNIEEQGVLLSAFFWGYIVTQLPGGLFSNKLGANRVYGFGIFMTSLLTILTPVVADHYGYWWIFALRLMEGFFEGVTFPSSIAFWSKWAPRLEQSKLAGVGYAGCYAGTVITMPLCGILADYYGWRSVFYIFGAVGIFWTIVWFVIASEMPENNRFISKEECSHILSLRNNKDRVVKFRDVPWKKILVSLPVYAFIMAHVCENWGFYTLLTELPTYMKHILKFDIKENGYLSGLPYLALTIAMFTFSYLADFIRERGYLSTKNVRKVSIIIGYTSQAIFILLTGFATDKVAAVTYLTFGVGLGGVAVSSLLVNSLDIGSKYSGILMGISNTFATIPGIVSPILSGILTQHQTLIEWRTVFYISASVYSFGAIFFGIFASGEIQPWARSVE